MSPALPASDAPVALSTASVFPQSTAAGFQLAARLGYDGIEVMVSTDPVSQDIEALRRLSEHHQVPILALHAPCLLLTQRVWGRDWAKLSRSREAAEQLGVRTVVVHPPFRWQRDYARDFVTGLQRLQDETDVTFAVENMYPLRARGTDLVLYAPHYSPLDEEFPYVTLDLSHTSAAQDDALEMAEKLGDRLAHLHLADGKGVMNRDEHLVPGRGIQPCADVLERLARTGYDGTVVLEVNTRRAENHAEREADLAEALAFTRLYLAANPTGDGSPR